MSKKSALFFLVIFVLSGVAQEASRTPTNQQLATKARVVCVESKTYFMKRAELEKALLGKTKFQEWGLQVTRDHNDADLVISVSRASFQNNFPYTVTDRTTGTVLFGGEVNSLLGTVYGKIADDFVEKLQDVREGRPPGKRK